MSLHLDGIVFSLQPHGGITVYFRELLQRLQGAEIRASLTLEQPVQQQLMASDAPGVEIVYRKARSVERFRDARPTADATLFHSSYYRRPARRSLPTVVTVHDFAYERCVGGLRATLHSLQKHAAIRQAQSIICISQATRDDLLELVGVRPDQQVQVVYNGVAETFRALEEHDLRPDHPPFALFVGQRGRYKNFALALAAMAHLPDMELHCVGGGPLRSAELAAADDRCRSRIRHLGYLSDAELNAQYNRAVCLLYPSAYEGFGIPVLEAMRAGCPVVSIGCKAVIEIGGDALTVADAEPRSLAEAVLVTRETTNRTALRLRGFAVARAFSWDRHFHDTLAVYRSMLR